MRNVRFALLIAISCLAYTTFRYASLNGNDNNSWRHRPYIERIPVEDFLLKELQMGMSLSKSNSLVIYGIYGQHLDASFAMRHQKNGDMRLDVQLNPTADDDDVEKKSRTSKIPIVISRQTERTMAYLLSRNLLPPKQNKSGELNDSDGYWIFYRVADKLAVAGIAHQSGFHSNHDAQEFADILKQFQTIAFGKSDEANLALTELDLITARMVIKADHQE